jgi:holo-[acyl-carrier protein] synthase
VLFSNLVFRIFPGRLSRLPPVRFDGGASQYYNELIMHSLGVDIIEIERIEKTMQRFGKRFLNRVYTESELRVCRNLPHRLASRFAAKEAVMKSLGTGTKGVGWREIEIRHDPKGKPLVYLTGRAKNRADALGLGELAISLSDSREYAVAFVVGETSIQ